MIGSARWWKAALVGLAVAAIGAGAWYWGRSGFAPRQGPPSKFLLPRAVAVAPGIYVLGKLDPAAAYVVETSEGLVLVDSGVEANAATVTAQLAELGFDASRLRAILLTHV